jgi:putative DNA primase/helicase
LGAMLRDNSIIAEAIGLVQAAEMYTAAHGMIFRAIADLHENGKPADIVTVADRIIQRKLVDEIGGVGYLAELWDAAPSAAHHRHYAEIIREQANRRRLIQLTRQIGERAFDPAIPSADLLADAERRIGEIAKAVQSSAEESLIAPVLVSLADVQAELVQWLWFGRIALGKVTLIAGDPGLGKSFVTLDIAARVSCGAAWPDAPEIKTTAGGVVLLSAEDDVADTIRPRLDAAGADVRRISALQAVRRNYKDDPSRESTFSLETDLPALEAAILKVSDCRLVVIDPITAYLGETDSHKNAEIRGLIAPLAALAAKLGVAVLCVTHLNKSAKGPAIYRAIGSIAFAAAARAVWAVIKDTDNPRRRLMLPAKNNLGPDTLGLAYTIEPYGPGGAPVVAWEAGPVEVSADDALQAEGDKEGREDGDQAQAWLHEALKDGPMPAADVLAQGKANGFTQKAIREAFHVLGCLRKKADFKGGWVWWLPSANEDSQGAVLPTGESSESSQKHEESSPVLDPENAKIPILEDGHLGNSSGTDDGGWEELA